MPIRCAIIGPGNIGTDLLYKAMRNPHLEPVWMVGIDPASEGLARAKALGLKTTSEGVDGMAHAIASDRIQLAFDATSATVHPHNSSVLNSQGVFVIDLTPAALGPYCVPSVNLEEHMRQHVMNVNMVSCGGQATIPIVAAVSRVQPVDYAEIVATVASRSIGPGTRKNIDEFTRTTARGIEVVGGAKQGKAIIVINPADPPILMRDTIHCLTRDPPQHEAIHASVQAMMTEIQRYVPGCVLKNGPIVQDRRVSVWLEVAGLGDFLPTWAGNLDIMTAAAVQTGALYARRISSGDLTLSTATREAS